MKTLFTLAVLTAATKFVYADKLYYSGEIRTRQPFRYGKFTTRMQGSNQRGTVASFFTFWAGDENGNGWSWQEWNEIDVELVPSIDGYPFNTNIIYENQSHDGQGIPNFDPREEWHTYTIEWTPQYIAWFLDGREVRRRTDSARSVQDMNKYQMLYMNFWTPEWELWGNGLNDATMPWYTRYDYVEAYDYIESTGEFILRFRDDFDTLDSNIWEVSNNWTFPQNSTTFMETHSYVVDGKLVLKMDHDLNPPQPSPEPNPNPTPQPCPELDLQPDAIMYGDICEDKHDRSLCGSDLSNCYKSWNAGDIGQWNSIDAQCRILPAQLDASSYMYGKLTADQQAGTCRETCQTECRWSWPRSDILRWKSDAVMARCMPQGLYPYE